MALNLVRFLSLFFAALALIPAGAHLAELPNKIGLSASDYLVVQQIYRGWALAGIVVIGALLSTLVLVLMLYSRRKPFMLALIAFLCIAGTQIIFWTFTYPVNQQTANWTVLPANWPALRDQWEYSHAVSAGLNLIALVSLILSLLPKDDP
ncbi:MAG: DUF1772 domain-containing protein [Candidatus Competibacteraceae bacterium]